MKVFISAAACWEGCTPGNPPYPRTCTEMTKEALAACRGAVAAAGQDGSFLAHTISTKP